MWHPVAVTKSAGGASKHIEVERKFDVSSLAVSPSFEGLAAVAQIEHVPSVTLDAVYYDTPTRSLASRQITLRRRTGGGDAGWHIKVPAGPHTRAEFRAPLGDADEDVPAGLRDVIAAVVRDQPLAPIARITTRRTVDLLRAADGTALAEFCDDQVIGAARGSDAEQHWREWEIELSEEAAAAGLADLQLLDRLTNRLLDAGAEPATRASKMDRVLDGSAQPASRTPIDDPVHRAVAAEVDNLLVWDRAVRQDAYDSVHQMRVTTRKIRSLLQASQNEFGLSRDAWILDELRQLAALLGLARDAEVLAEKYEHALDELPTELVRGPVRERLVDGARRRYRSAWRKSLNAMRSQRYFRLLDAMEALADAEPMPAAPRTEPVSVTTVEAGYKRVRKRARAAGKAEPEHRDEALHRIRKSAKRLRYTASATGAKSVSRAAKTIQTLLGDHQDSVVSRSHLRHQANTAHAAGEDTFTYGLLYQREVELARRCEEQLRATLRTLDEAVKKVR